MLLVDHQYRQMSAPLKRIPQHRETWVCESQGCCPFELILSSPLYEELRTGEGCEPFMMF